MAFSFHLFRYIAELSPPGIRGKLLSLNIVFITGGQFISCTVALAVA